MAEGGIRENHGSKLNRKKVRSENIRSGKGNKNIKFVKNQQRTSSNFLCYFEEIKFSHNNKSLSYSEI
jgi:hypothetical protein